MIKSRGFTLIELAIVLVIITILIGGLAMPLSAQIQARRIAETNRTLEEAREAILGYAMSHTTSECSCLYKVDNPVGPQSTPFDPASTCRPLSRCPSPALASFTPDASGTLELAITLQAGHHLPCPDVRIDLEPGVDNDADGLQNDANNGREDRKADGSCLDKSGNLPWATLGTATQDAWGNRLRYAVVTQFANELNGFSASTPAPPPLGFDPIKICSTHSCSSPDVADNVVFVLVSHGPNGWGALGVNGNQLAAPTGANELENIDADSTYVSHTPYKPADGSAAEKAKEFDDLTVWVSQSHLIARVCPTGCSP